MCPHYVLFVHGIGDYNRDEDFSGPLERAVRTVFEREATAMLGQRPVGRPDMRRVWWSDITQHDQNALWACLLPDLGKKSLSIGSWLTSPGTWWPRVRYWAPAREFIVNCLGDSIAYLEKPGVNKYRLIHDRVMDYVNDCSKDASGKGATSQQPALLTVVAHSLGSVIASDLVYDVKHKGRAWPAEIRLANYFTLGSPLALYVLRYGFDKPHESAAPPPFSSPTKMDDPDGRWVNIFDPQDPLGYPLRPINKPYEDAVLADKVINAGQAWKIWQWPKQSSPFSHTLYWDDATVARLIGRKVALDWLRENHPELEGRLRQAYADYPKWVADA